MDRKDDDLSKWSSVLRHSHVFPVDPTPGFNIVIVDEGTLNVE